MATWKFTQISGDRKTLTLDGASAPHGRPRQSPVVEDGISLRASETYYSGRAVPTRHIGGVRHKPLELKGRFNDADLGSGGANSAAADWKQFVADGQLCRIEWGNILAFTGLVEEFTPSRESDAEIAYTIKIAIDSDDSMVSKPFIPDGKSLEDKAALLSLGIDYFDDVDLTPPEAGLPSDFFDTIEDAIGTLRGATGLLVTAANGIDNIEKAIASDLEKVKYACIQVQTALTTLRLTMDSAVNDAALATCDAQTATTFYQARSEAATQALALASLAADILTTVERVQQGDRPRTYTVQDGDTWESISVKFYGGLSRTVDIRDANNIRTGTKPVPGQVITIP